MGVITLWSVIIAYMAMDAESKQIGLGLSFTFVTNAIRNCTIKAHGTGNFRDTPRWFLNVTMEQGKSSGRYSEGVTYEQQE